MRSQPFSVGRTQRGNDQDPRRANRETAAASEVRKVLSRASDIYPEAAAWVAGRRQKRKSNRASRSRRSAGDGQAHKWQARGCAGGAPCLDEELM